MIKKLINTFEKKIYKEITLIEVILLLTGFFLSTLVIILYYSLVERPEGISSFNYYFWPFLIWFDVSFGIVAALALSKKWKYAWILLIFDAIFYGAGLIPGQSYALVFVNLILTPLLLVISSYTWNYKKKYNKENSSYIEIKIMNKREWFFAILGSIIFIIFASLLIIHFSNLDNSKWTIIYTVIGAIIASIVICAMIFSSLRYQGTFVMFLLSNSLKVPFFLLVTIFFGIQGSLLMMTLFLMYSLLAVIFLFNALYGLYIWSKN